MKQLSSQKSGGDETCEINVVPLADISLVLLIILMLITPLVMQSMIQVAASRRAVAAAPDQKKTEKPLFVEIRNDGFFLNKNRMESADQLQRTLAGELSRKEDRTVILTAGPGVTHGTVVTALDRAKQAGAEKLSLVKRVPL